MISNRSPYSERKCGMKSGFNDDDYFARLRNVRVELACETTGSRSQLDNICLLAQVNALEDGPAGEATARNHTRIPPRIAQEIPDECARGVRARHITIYAELDREVATSGGVDYLFAHA